MKKVIECPICWKKSNIPSDKHIRFNCPKCHALIETKGGEIVSFKERISLNTNDTYEKKLENRHTKEKYDDFEYIYTQKQKNSLINNSSKWRTISVLVLVITIVSIVLVLLSQRHERIRIWEKAYADYIEKNRDTNIPNEAERFIHGLLKNGKESGHNKVFIIFNPNIKLTDWEEFPLETRNLLDSIFMLINNQDGVLDPLPSNSPPKRIRGRVNTNKAFLEDIIVETLQMQFDSLFNPNPIVIEKRIGTHSKAQKPLAYISINYLITTLTSEDSTLMHYPILYRYIQDFDLSNMNPTSRRYTFLGYLLSTKINWSTTFSIPEMDIHYTIESESRPIGDITGKRSDPYDDIMEAAFKNYALSVANDVGVKTTEE